MRMPCTALVFLLALAGQPLEAADYRFQALIDLDGDPTNGCDVDFGATALRGSELRAFAHTDRDKIRQVVLQRCRDARWQDEFESLDAAPIGFGQGEAGSDRVRWSLPLSYFATQSGVSMRVVSERLDQPAQDILGDGATPRVLALELGGTANPLPALDGIGLLIVTLALIWLGNRHLRLARRVAPWVILPLLACAAVQLVQPISGATADVMRAVAASDAGNDSADAGSDLLEARIAVVGQTLEFQFDVNNIEDNGLTADARILFIGNSLTYYYEIPLMVQAIAAQSGKTLTADAITAPGASLEDHFLQQTAHAALANGGYHWVIMQQGPSSLPASQNHLRTWASRFDSLIRAGGARPALYMVWPDAAHSTSFGDVYDSYSNAALAINGMLIPAGEAWRWAWNLNPGLPLYGPDHFHPSPMGSYAAALSIFAELYQQSPIDLPAQFRLSNGHEYQFDPAQARILQIAAWRTHVAMGRRGG
jgi:hypothetical protein